MLPAAEAEESVLTIWRGLWSNTVLHEMTVSRQRSLEVYPWPCMEEDEGHSHQSCICFVIPSRCQTESEADPRAPACPCLLIDLLTQFPSAVSMWSQRLHVICVSFPVLWVGPPGFSLSTNRIRCYTMGNEPVSAINQPLSRQSLSNGCGSEPKQSMLWKWRTWRIIEQEIRGMRGWRAIRGREMVEKH